MKRGLLSANHQETRDQAYQLGVDFAQLATDNRNGKAQFSPQEASQLTINTISEMAELLGGTVSTELVISPRDCKERLRQGDVIAMSAEPYSEQIVPHLEYVPPGSGDRKIRPTRVLRVAKDGYTFNFVQIARKH